MNGKEALKAMIDGERIVHPVGCYSIGGLGEILLHNRILGSTVIADWQIKDFMANKAKDFSIYKEPEHVFKPFDQVLVRDSDTNKWSPEFFSHIDLKGLYKYISITNLGWEHCIPYKGNEHLLGTTGQP